jgi:hypothetical protein
MSSWVIYLFKKWKCVLNNQNGKCDRSSSGDGVNDKPNHAWALRLIVK